MQGVAMGIQQKFPFRFPRVWPVHSAKSGSAMHHPEPSLEESTLSHIHKPPESYLTPLVEAVIQSEWAQQCHLHPSLPDNIQ
jgi:hypothetical protein